MHLVHCFSRCCAFHVLAVYIWSSVVILPSVNGEVFTALATISKSLYTEKELAQELRKYVAAENERLNNVLHLADKYDAQANAALLDPEAYVANPVNAFLFVKGFTLELNESHSLLSSAANAQGFFNQLELRQPYLPDSEDLEGIIAAVLRLQDTYQLSPSQMADGTFTPTNRSPNLTASDCFEIGFYAYQNKDWYHMALWMQQALNIWDQELTKTIGRAKLLDFMAYATHMQGNVRYARQLTNEWLQIEPTHERAISNLLFYDEELDKLEDEYKAKGLPVPSREDGEVKYERVGDWYRKSDEFLTYEALCRGEDVMVNPYQHSLKCYYSDSNRDPVLILAPVKVEEYYLDPLLLLYHDVISEKEIEIIKELATPKLNRATVNDPVTGKLVTASYRVSRSAWLPDELNATVATLTRRVAAITHLNMDHVELLQVVNYGIGGQYEPHFDFSRDRGPEKDTFGAHEGNRVATWIFYFTDVDAGGYTVFTTLGVKIPPLKGGAGFWWNLFKNGRGDERTRHAGCPVLAGSKWVANKWMHERGQEFMRPCDLNSEK